MHKLIIEDDEGRTTVVPLVRDELTIGRKEGNAIRLTERNVSRRHARLFKRNGDVCVEDFASYTGVRVNGVRINAPTALRDSDQVQIGDYKLSVRSEAADVVPPTVPGMPMTLAAADGVAQASSVAPPPQPHATPSPHLDAAPTMPLRTLEEEGRAPKIANATPGRLVVVSTDLAGTEFRLDRPSLVIGRTEENDIILNHASISRHHAKVVRDGDRYTVVDLQSANGVRVAGESYERVEIQPGDVVELGHVKLRFVGPWEDWTFDAGDFAPKSRRNLKIAAGAGGIVLAAILVFALQGKKQTVPVIAIAVPQPTSAPPAATLFADATAAVAAENWDKAVSALDLLLSRPPEGPQGAAIMAQAVNLKAKVDLERRSAELLLMFDKAVADKEPDVAMSRYDEIPPESVYKSRAEPALDKVKTLFLNAHLELADAARAQGHCDEAAAEVEKVQQIDPENRQAHDIVRKCKPKPPVHLPNPAATAPDEAPAPPVAARAPTVPATRTTAPAPSPRPVAQPSTSSGTVARANGAKAVPPRPVRPAPGVRTVVATTPTLDGSSPSGTTSEVSQSEAASDLIRQAREAWMRQQCGTAIDLSRRALKLKPGTSEAHQIIAVCACSTRDKEGAIKSYSKLDERSRAMVRTLCARSGIELVE
jgi:pSer/pThr/pTyr-binding forkhead associated (FHA) protein